MEFKNIDLALQRLSKNLDAKSFKALSSGIGLGVCKSNYERDKKKKISVDRDVKIFAPYSESSLDNVENDLLYLSELIRKRGS